MKTLEVNESMAGEPEARSRTEAIPGVAVHVGDEGVGLGLASRGSPGEIAFAVGDLVWGKTKGQPWWPALVSDPSRALDDPEKAHRRDVSFLVTCFGSGAFAWCEPAQLKPFVEEFRRMARQSSSKGFVGAVEGALDEMRQRLQLALTCCCVLPEARGKNDGGPPGRLPVTNVEPIEFLEHLHDVACDVMAADMLEVAALKSWTMAFGKGWTDGAPGCHPRRQIMELVDKIDLDVPPGDLGDGNEEGNDDYWITGSRVGKGLRTSQGNMRKIQKRRSMAMLIAETDLDTDELSNCDELEEEEKVKAAKHQMKSENEEDMVSGGRSIKAQEDPCSGRRERKRSKYLSPPYTCLGAYTMVLDLPVGTEVKSPRKAAEAPGALNSDISALLRCNSEAFQKEEDNGSPGFSVENTSMIEILFEFLCTAKNPLHLKWNQSTKMIKGFFIKYRTSMYSSGSDFLTFQKHSTECCDGSGQSSNKVTTNTSSGVGECENNWWNSKGVAISEAETGFGADTKSRSEQGKPGQKRKMRLDEATSVSSVKLDPQVVNVPVESRYVHKNIKNKDGATEESVVLCPEPVSCLQPAEIGNKMNKGKRVADGQKALKPGHDLSERSQGGKSGRKRKKSKPANIGVPLGDFGRGIMNGLEKDICTHSYPGALLLTFAHGVPLPSQNELTSTFRKYGVLIESETELLKETNSARIVFAKITDAEKAFNSSDKTGYFRPPYASYCLCCLPEIACSPHPVPPLPYLREGLERTISTLAATSSLKETGTSDGMKHDARENLVGDMEGLLKKVNTMLSGAATGT
ncbi:hypothetical protein B296_00056465 [Ensete ventricosum]|uniref:PWWP domain-containing protein n=1 Tax=Ensete ventricosum TaxID=4639 RepID=A0A426XV65_ENSVE|nr:hypothetical protein B296_00056465 [Ensete ventricosum]